MSGQIKKGTVLSALMWAASELRTAGIESSRLDSELLLSEVLGLSRVQLYINYDRPMNQDEKERFLALIKRRQKREPVAYILGRKEFFSLQFYVDRNVLIPRPETECMVEWILSNAGLNEESRLIDVGTGSGCIAVSVLRNSSVREIFVSDISQEALAVAERNLKILCPDKKYFAIRSSLFENVRDSGYDLIVSNPPYIRTELLKSLSPDITEFEPRIALDGGRDGNEIILRLIEESHRYLRDKGLLVFEHSEEFGLREDILRDRFGVVFLGRDYSGRPRFTVLKKL